MANNLHKIGWLTATSLVVSSMVGTGVFTSLGFQLVDVHSTWSIILLWLLGGGLALIGAFTFAELGTHYQQTGGDYVFISQAIHPLGGYLSAWTSMTVGFSAPVAIAAMAMESYLAPLGVPYLRWISVGFVVAISGFHSVSLKQSGHFQNFSTIFKLLFAVGLLGLGIWVAPVANNALDFNTRTSQEICKPSFAVSLLYVTYAYTGWNASAYIVDEIDNPRKNLPRSLIVGTLIVTVLYVLLQLVFLKTATTTQLKGQVEVALISFGNVVPPAIKHVIAACIALQLVATMSAYVWVGPRILQAMSQHYRLWHWLGRSNTNGIPVVATWFQCVVTLVLIFSGSLEQVTLYTSFLLQLMGTLAVASIFFTKRQPYGYHSPWRPYLQYLYVAFSGFVLFFIITDRPKESLIGLGILVLGLLSYWVNKRLSS